MALIEDEELRALFQTESEEHLQSLDDGLLRLESSPHDTHTLEEVFRAAHSLKGTARMLGVTGVERLAHHMEDELGNAKRGRTTLDAPAIDRLCFGVDAIRLLVDEAVTNVPAGIDLARAQAQLTGQVPLDTPSLAPAVRPAVPHPIEVVLEVSPPIPLHAAPEPGPAPPELQAAPDEPAEPHKHLQPQLESPVELPIELPPHIESGIEPAHAAIPLPPASASSAVLPTEPLAPLTVASPAEPSGEISGAAIVVADEAEPLAAAEAPASAAIEVSEAVEGRGDFKIQTMRVPPARLDALMTLASELSVTANRVARELSLFDDISNIAEEWRKDIAASDRILHPVTGTSGALAASEGEAMKKLGELHGRERAHLGRLEAALEQLAQTTQEELARLSAVAGEMEDGIRKVRLLPFSTIFNLFARPVRDLAREQGKEVRLVIEGGETAADKRVLEELKDPLLHMIRNAIDHGIETPEERFRSGKPAQATLRLRAFQTASNVIVELSDDGRGLDTMAIRGVAHKKRLLSLEELEAMPEEQVQLLIFAPGFSTSAIISDVSGRGVGMDVVRTNVERLKGDIQVRSVAGVGCAFHIQLPITLATTRALLVEVGGRPYALPIEFVQGMMPIAPEQFFSIEGQRNILFESRALPIARLSDLLELDSPGKGPADTHKATCVVLRVGEEKLGLLVDALLDEQEVMLKPLGAMLKRVRNISGATILGAGEVCLILNPHDLLKSMHSTRRLGASQIMPQLSAESGQEITPKSVLLAEDSLATRTLEKRILEAAGYHVVTAVDGADALAKLGTQPFDAVVSDVEMPNLSGLGLAAKIRQDARYNEMPIILVTSLASEEDRQRGAEAGANAYITKGGFDQKALLDALERLV